MANLLNALMAFDFSKVTDWITSHLKAIILTVVIIVVMIVILIILRFTILKIKKTKNKRSYTVAQLLENIAKYATILIAIFAILGIWGINITAALSAVGILGLIVGLGAQDLIKDFLGGMGIIFDNEYEIDDIVEINGFKGKVTEIGLRTTKLVNYAGEIRIIRNGSITELSNFSRTFSVAAVNVDVAYKENLDKVIALLEEKLPAVKESYPQIIEGPIVVGVDELGASAVSIKVTTKTEPEEHYAVKRALLKYIKDLFDENNVEIPFNQIVVHEGKDE